ncbi:MAG: hypothetical protein IKW41_05960 [Phascolarctobacterium sp.]|nr:hypothetical protein [Phascolarctobacterium sp.]
MNTIKLLKPFKVNGKEVKELTYDTGKITAGQFCQAEVRRFEAGGNKPSLTTYEFDHGLHLYLGMMAIVAENPQIDITDLERITGFDMIQIAKVGRNFILAGAGSDLDQSNSGDLSGTTQEPTTVAP